MIRDIFVVNRDKKITIHDKKITNRDYFLVVRNGLAAADAAGFVCYTVAILLAATS